VARLTTNNAETAARTEQFVSAGSAGSALTVVFVDT
jgi:hypothetical protein